MLKSKLPRLAAAAVAVLLPFAEIGTALAAKGKVAKSSSRQVVNSAPVDSALRARADARDPSGEYRGFADWARFALGSSRAGNSR